MKNKTKCFAVATAVLLTLCLVFAAPVGAASITVTTEEDLRNNLSTSGTVILGQQIILTSANTLSVPNGVTVILDLNGYILGVDSNNEAKPTALITNNGELTIQDSSSDKTGKITSGYFSPDTDWGTEGFPTYATNTIKNQGKLTVNSGTIESSTKKGGASYAIDCYQGSTLIVNGGTIQQIAGDVAIRMFANSKTEKTSVLINDGVISGKRAVWIHLPGSCYGTAPIVELTVKGGTLSSNIADQPAIYSYSYGNSFANTNIIIEDGIFNGDVAFSGGLANYLKSNTHNCLELESCLKNVDARALETVTVSGGTFNGDIYSYGVDDSENKKQAMGPFITGGTFGEDPSKYVKDTHEAVLVGGKYVVAAKGSLKSGISATDVGFDSVKVGYTQPDAKKITVTNTGDVDVVLLQPTVENYIVTGFTDEKLTILAGNSAEFSIMPEEGLPVGNYGVDEVALKIEGSDAVMDTFKVSFLVYQPSSGGSSKPVEEPVEPEIPEEPEVPTEEPEAGEATVETEVTDGGEVEFEAPVEEPEAGEVGTPAADEDEAKITGVVLPTGTDSEVTFVPISEQAAPEGKETQTKKVFEINVPTYEKGKPATIKFTMTVAELAADGKEAADVALWHFDEETGEWTKLVTSYTIVDGIVYFEAITNDFSPFAIVYEDEPVNEPVEEPETPASPAPVLGLIAALGAAVVLRRK